MAQCHDRRAPPLAVKQPSCIDKTFPCFVLVSYYMLKILGSKRLSVRYGFASGQIVVMDERKSLSGRAVKGEISVLEVKALCRNARLDSIYL